MNCPTHPSRPNSVGFAMLEVLIAILVVSFGLLGLAGLQAVGLRNNHSAYMRSIATQEAYDIADRMRANKVGADAGNYHMTSTTTPTDPNCITSGCTTANMAVYDAYEWKTNLASLLPGGVGVVCLDSTPNDGTQTAVACDGVPPTYAIKIWWNDDKNTGTNPTLKRFVTSFQP